MLGASFALLESTPLERRRHFESISAPSKPEEFHHRLRALVELTKQGKDVATFESDLMPLLIEWLEDWFKAAATARRREKEKGSKVHGCLIEEGNLNEIYNYVKDVVRFSFSAFQEQDISSLLSQLLQICKRTPVSSDIRHSIDIFNALVTYGEIPRSMLEPCLDVLCGAYGTVKDLADSIWNTTCNLCKSHTAQNTISALLDIVRSPSTQGDRNTNTIRGAVLVLTRIIISGPAEGLATVPFSAAMDAFQMSLVADSLRLELEVVEAVVKLFEDDNFTRTFMDESDWSVLLDILAQCSRKVSEVASAHSRGAKEKEHISRMSDSLTQVVHHLEMLCSGSAFGQKQNVIDFFKAIYSQLPNTGADLLVQHYSDEHLCYPSNPDWLTEARWLVRAFFDETSRPASTRLLVIRAINDVYQIIADHFPSTTITQLVMPVFDIMPRETDSDVLEGMKVFAAEVAVHAEEAVFDALVASLYACVTYGGDSDATSPAVSTTKIHHSHKRSDNRARYSPAANTAILALVAIFLRTLNTSASKTSKIFDLLLETVRSREYDIAARISALRALFRLRSDSAYAISLTTITDNEALASAVGRAPESLDAKRSKPESARDRRSRHNAAASNRSSRSSSPGTQHSFAAHAGSGSTQAASRLLKRASHWIYPEEDALPEPPPLVPSGVVFSHVDEMRTKVADNGGEPMLVLKVTVWLEVLISVLQQGDHWDLYSYILVHLGSQLTNHSFFVGAVPQIQMLRNVLCEQLRVNSFHDPPPSSGLKRQDVMICLFHTLAILLTYREHFSKNEQDEIVRTFILGVGSGERAAKHCIHALSICCHELPLSISKSLNSILQKMSQIITQSQMAAHILEFLTGLARMPEVYVNFREDDYRTVFGISFRYLQYVRDQRQKASEHSLTRASIASDSQVRPKRESGPATESTSVSNTANDLPQYVYALAYHVIMFWFVSVKLVDRPKYISWITKNLVVTDSTGKEMIDEQSQVTIDMMQKITYSDHDETLPDPDFACPSDGYIMKKSWLVGLSILTVETAVRSGVSQLIKRQPSATTYATYRPKLAQRPLHQIPLGSKSITTDVHEEDTRVEVLPHHILLQLTSSPWRIPESMRPIPLPDDEFTRRAMGLFDRNSTVDGHKVGIIYIGEGQTNEAEILSNVVGSEDFTSFLTKIGTLTKLKGASFNTQGLDRELDTDGEFTFCWRDRLTEIIFHIPTMMPTDPERDPHCINKKRHTGNDFVNIIFNNSGLPFRFDTFPSEFNCVNIVITPEARYFGAATPVTQHADPDRQFYEVQVMSKPGFPEIPSAAETKVVSGKSLPAFVRLTALNASVFSLVWANRETGELVSSWRNRLREIVRLREKHLPGGAQVSSTGSLVGSGQGIPGIGSRETNAQQRESVNLHRRSGPTFFGEGISSHRSSVLSTATTATETDAWGSTDAESLADGYDFSKWT